MTPPLSKAGAAKLGSEGDWIRQGLFGCQPMREILQHVKLNGAGPFQSIADAHQLANDGRLEEAKSILRSILSATGSETRVELWVWSALRELSERPEPKLAFEILGTVVEVPVQGAYDILAAYKDGSARYLNFSGKAIFWDAKEAAIRSLCQALIDSTVPSASRAMPRLSVSLPKSGVQVTLLTRSGMFVIPSPPMTIGNAASALMTELVRRTKVSRPENAESGD